MLDLGATTFWEDFNLDWIPNAAPIDEPVPAGKKTYMAISAPIAYSRIPSPAFATGGPQDLPHGCQIMY